MDPVTAVLIAEGLVKLTIDLPHLIPATKEIIAGIHAFITGQHSGKDDLVARIKAAQAVLP